MAVEVLSAGEETKAAAVEIGHADEALILVIVVVGIVAARRVNFERKGRLAD